MNPEDLHKRQERARNETFVIAVTDTGYRIHSPASGGKVYLVGLDMATPCCTCPDFTHHAEDPEWCCKHILAVQEWRRRQEGAAQTAAPANVEAPQAEGPMRGGIPPAPQLLLKRSVSPDGRIDSLSVELSVPISQIAEREVRERARRILKAQSSVVREFLAAGDDPTAQRVAEDDSVDAVLRAVGAMDTRFGRRLYVNVDVGRRSIKYFGTRQQLVEALTEAGLGSHTGNLSEGVILNLACRVITRQSEDGRYTNVVKFLPSGQRTTATTR
jgi:hypothetical protein